MTYAIPQGPLVILFEESTEDLENGSFMFRGLELYIT